jgi:hypothetical protein
MMSPLRLEGKAGVPQSAGSQVGAVAITTIELAWGEDTATQIH